MKIAYLIAAHNRFENLSKLVEFLDSENADFYIHIDRKVTNFNPNLILDKLTYSKCYFIESVNVNWGGYSQIKCTLSLLKNAIVKRYEYYHYISGVDFPIKSRRYIEEFTFNHLNVNFIDFEEKNISEEYINRINYFYFLQDLNVSDKRIKNILFKIDNASKKLQKLLKINRINNKLYVYFNKGSNWFSINYLLAKDIVDNFYKLESSFKYSRCADELFIQTMVTYLNKLDTVYNCKQKNCSKNSARYTDWCRGKPYSFKISDIQELLTTSEECLFARKIEDINVVNELEKYLV